MISNLEKNIYLHGKKERIASLFGLNHHKCVACLLIIIHKNDDKSYKYMNNDLKMTVKLDEKKEKYIKFEWNNVERKNCLSFLSIRQEN